MRDLQIKLMYQEASARLADAELLSTSIFKQSDADYLIRLLAFEILLKCVLLIHTGRLIRNHGYKQLFEELPELVRKTLVEAASERMPLPVNYSKFNDKLDVFSHNFVYLRYPYEAYDGLTEEKYTKLGESWIDKGAPEEEAAFVYHPQELNGLIYALSQEVEMWLTNKSHQLTSTENIGRR